MDLDRHELVSGHLGHCHEDSLVQRSLAKLGGDVFGYRPDGRNHLSSLFLKKLRVHETLIAVPSEVRQRAVVKLNKSNARRAVNQLGNKMADLKDRCRNFRGESTAHEQGPADILDPGNPDPGA